MKNIWLLFISIYLSSLFGNILVAQRPLNNISINFLGNSPVVSMNYERIFPVNNFFIFATGLGIGLNSTFHKSTSTLTTPYHLTGNIGKGVYFFEFGLTGGVGYQEGESQNGTIMSPILGYRYQPIKRRTANFRIYTTYSKAFSIKKSDLWFGCSFGALF